MKLLLFLLLFSTSLAVTALGLLMITSPDGSSSGLSVAMLTNTPFHDFRLPGIILLLLVGIPCYLATLAQERMLPGRYNWAIAAGLLICAWGVGLMIFITLSHWLPFAALGIGLLTVLAAYQLKGKWAL